MGESLAIFFPTFYALNWVTFLMKYVLWINIDATIHHINECRQPPFAIVDLSFRPLTDMLSIYVHAQNQSIILKCRGGMLLRHLRPGNVRSRDNPPQQWMPTAPLCYWRPLDSAIAGYVINLRACKKIAHNIEIPLSSTPTKFWAPNLRSCDNPPHQWMLTLSLCYWRPLDSAIAV